jgi:inosine/xanthosine triphosphatase
MKIKIGSKNKAKVEALEEVLMDYDDLKNAEIISEEVESEVADQPKSLEETIRGAKNRARKIFEDCEYSFGIESGLMEIPDSKDNFVDITVCVIYDGKKFSSGFSSCFECPKEISRLMLEEDLNMSEAALSAGLTKNPKIGSAEGLIGLLTKGRMTRKDYTKQAIVLALIQIENRELYQ